MSNSSRLLLLIALGMAWLLVRPIPALAAPWNDARASAWDGMSGRPGVLRELDQSRADRTWRRQRVPAAMRQDREVMPAAWTERASAEEVPPGKIEPRPDAVFSDTDPTDGAVVEAGPEYPAYFDGGGWDNTPGYCGPSGCGVRPGVCGPSSCCSPPGYYWVAAEYLLWFTKGMPTPPLVTTSPNGTVAGNAGVINQSGTTILFGDQDLLTRNRSGGRIRFGTWIDCNQVLGVEGEFLMLQNLHHRFGRSSNGNPILARPFINANDGLEDAELVAYPNIVSGTVDVDAISKFMSAGARVRLNLICERMAWENCDGCLITADHGCEGSHRVDLIAGYRFMRLDESIEIREQLTSTDPEIPNTSFAIRDSFSTKNEFHGGELGLLHEYRRCRWTVDLLTKVALGNTHETVTINGTTTQTSSGVSTTSTGGIYAQRTNIGVYEQDRFAVVPEGTVTLGRYLTPRLKATFGYSIVYWSRVARPGDQIDRVVDPGLFPPEAQGTHTRPAFAFHESSYWAQGLNFGLDYRW